MAFQEDFGKMFRPSGATRSDNRNMEGLSNGLRQFAIEAGLGAVSIHGSQKDFTGAACLNFPSPFQSVQFGLLRAAVSQYSPAWSGPGPALPARQGTHKGCPYERGGFGPALQGHTFLAAPRHSPARIDSHDE